MKRTYLILNPKKLTRKEQKKLWILFLAKLGFTKLNPEKKVIKARDIVSAMSGNPNFPTPNPALADVSDAADALYDAEQALDGTVIKTAERNAAEAVLDGLMSTLQSYVDTTAGKDTLKILSAGFEVRKSRTKATKLEAPVDLTILANKVEGQIKLKFKPVKKKSLYLVEVAQDFPGPLNWQFGGESTKATVSLEGLNSGQKYHIRVAAVNAAGIGDWSDEIIGRAS
jgi:hypothetical protein